MPAVCFASSKQIYKFSKLKHNKICWLNTLRNNELWAAVNIMHINEVLLLYTCASDGHDKSQSLLKTLGKTLRS